jgi:hypothetical protein
MVSLPAIRSLATMTLPRRGTNGVKTLLALRPLASEGMTGELV